MYWLTCIGTTSKAFEMKKEQIVSFGYSSISRLAKSWPVLAQFVLCVYLEVLPSKLDWFLSTIDVLWEKIAALAEFS